MIQSHDTKVELDKPTYVGCDSLDLSKLHMLNCRYNTSETQFKGSYKVIYNATDNLNYLMEHADTYEWMKENRTEFDSSGSKREDMKDGNNKKVRGKSSD
jgi:hypothetical protein